MVNQEKSGPILEEEGDREQLDTMSAGPDTILFMVLNHAFVEGKLYSRGRNWKSSYRGTSTNLK